MFIEVAGSISSLGSTEMIVRFVVNVRQSNEWIRPRHRCSLVPRSYDAKPKSVSRWQPLSLTRGLHVSPNAGRRTFRYRQMRSRRGIGADMGVFIYQIQSASDYLKGGTAWLSGQKPPVYEDNERRIDEVRARIQKTVAFVESLEEQFANADERQVSTSWLPGELLMGEKYLLPIVIPNVSTAYAILRHHGIDVSRMDFLGPIDFKWALRR
jgi:hypothetical protein